MTDRVTELVSGGFYNLENHRPLIYWRCFSFLRLKTLCRTGLHSWNNKDKIHETYTEHPESEKLLLGYK